MHEKFSLSAEHCEALARGHMTAEVELAIEDPEYLRSLRLDAAEESDPSTIDYYDALFAEIARREKIRENERHPQPAPVGAPRVPQPAMAASDTGR